MFGACLAPSSLRVRFSRDNKRLQYQRVTHDATHPLLFRIEKVSPCVK